MNSNNSNPTPQRPPFPPRRSDNNLWKILGIAIGALIFVALVVIIVLLLMNNQKEDGANKADESTEFVAKERNKDIEEKSATQEEAEEHIVAAEEKIAATPARNPKQINTWTTGRHTFYGDFHFKGADYGFTITLDYNAASNTISNAKYEADGYGGASKIKGSLNPSEMTLTFSGVNSGTSTRISTTAYSLDGPYTGTMVRGANSGTCTLRMVE